jgi:hypothetical protein
MNYSFQHQSASLAYRLVPCFPKWFWQCFRTNFCEQNQRGPGVESSFGETAGTGDEVHRLQMVFVGFGLKQHHSPSFFRPRFLFDKLQLFLYCQVFFAPMVKLIKISPRDSVQFPIERKEHYRISGSHLCVD